MAGGGGLETELAGGAAAGFFGSAWTDRHTYGHMIITIQSDHE